MVYLVALGINSIYYGLFGSIGNKQCKGSRTFTIANQNNMEEID